MNENIDLTKILDGCPVGTEFYCSIFGAIRFLRITDMNWIEISTEIGNRYLTASGKFYADEEQLFDDECIFFPSKYQRDWSKFERFWDKPKTERFDPKTLQPFDRILARDYGNDTWTACLFSHHVDELDNDWYVCDNTYWRFVIPYNDDTKHLVGTKNDCPEYYKWWKE